MNSRWILNLKKKKKQIHSPQNSWSNTMDIGVAKSDRPETRNEPNSKKYEFSLGVLSFRLDKTLLKNFALSWNIITHINIYMGLFQHLWMSYLCYVWPRLLYNLISNYNSQRKASAGITAHHLTIHTHFFSLIFLSFPYLFNHFVFALMHL